MERCHDDVRDAFHRLVELSEEDRAIELGRLAREDIALSVEVAALLEQDRIAETTGFLPISERVPLKIFDRSIKEGRRIGPYEIRGVLGRGGNGTVYLAARVEHYDQLVALKVLHEHLDEVGFERFRLEIRTLARLVHPNIVRLLDGGTTETGLPYFVMEHVEGERLDAYCDSRGLSDEERVELVAQVGQAIAYAHENNVLHRDLKPGNVLVGKDGKPKVIDFGFAHLLKSDATEPLTMPGVILGTPGYMAPEQIDRRLGPVSPATDAFGLGAIFFRLLVGEPPSGPERLEASMRNVSPAEQPPLRKLKPGASRDLETILSKAMAQKPADRFVRMDDFVEQLRRFLAKEPLTIVPLTILERLENWAAKRRKALLAWGVAAVVVMCVILGTLLRANDRIQNALRAESTQRKRADDNLAILRETLKQSTLAIEYTIDKVPLGSDASHEFLTEMVRLCDKAMTQIPGGAQDADLRFRAALAHHQLAKSYEARDAAANLSKTLAHFDRAVGLFATLVIEDKTDKTRHVERMKWHRYNLFRSLYSRAYGRLRANDAAKAEADVREALKVIESLARDFPDDPDWKDAVAFQYCTLAGFLMGEARSEERRKAATEAKRIAAELVAEWPGRPEFVSNVQKALKILTDSAIERQSWQEAASLAREALECNAKLIAAKPEDHYHPHSRTLIQVDLARALSRLGHTEEAEALYSQAIESAERQSKAYSHFETYLLHPLTVLESKAKFLHEQGREQEAKAVYESIIERLKTLLAARPQMQSAHEILVRIEESCPIVELRKKKGES